MAFWPGGPRPRGAPGHDVCSAARHAHSVVACTLDGAATSLMREGGRLHARRLDLDGEATTAEVLTGVWGRRQERRWSTVPVKVSAATSFVLGDDDFGPELSELRRGEASGRGGGDTHLCWGGGGAVAAGEATVIAPLPTTVDSGFAGTALKTNTSAVDGDLREKEEEVELRPVAREMLRCGGSYRGER
jgi:hypothetical protein